MAEHTGGNIIWHPETITPGMAETLRTLRDRGPIGHAYLAGGTALALRFGHRLSVHLGFLAPDLFDEDALLARRQSAAHDPCGDPGNEGEFSRLSIPRTLPTGPVRWGSRCRSRDIACMKLSAVASRGTKRDLIDLYVASAQFGLAEILAWFVQKYAQTGYSRLHLLKSLTYFADAGRDPLPHMLLPLAWEDVVSFFKKEVPTLL